VTSKLINFSPLTASVFTENVFLFKILQIKFICKIIVIKLNLMLVVPSLNYTDEVFNYVLHKLINI